MNLFRILLCWSLLAAVSALAQETAQRPAERPKEWARSMSLPGVGNFYEVTTNLYRGAQPTAEGMKQLKAMGIKTVINLRAFHSEEDKADGAGLKDVHLPITPLVMNDAEVVAFLKVVSNTNNLPVFIHCERGADRTGTLCAMYRIAICGWTKDKAIEEMERGGFKFSPVWQNLISYIQKADVAEIRRQAGLTDK